ncbi:MAG: porin [Alistipes sp.]|nr:porin [Alistipes sp.]
MRRLLGWMAVAMLGSQGVYAQQDSVSLEACTRVEVPETPTALEPGSEGFYRPKIFGAIKARLEVDLSESAYRFNVRAARFGLKGNVASGVSYQMQVDFCAEGKITVLDAFVRYRVGKWEASLGQQQYHFSIDMDRSAAANPFANRSFLAKYITSYYGSELSNGVPVGTVKNLGSRDLGFNLSYRFAGAVPVRLMGSLFNGSGINNPTWSGSVNYQGRIEIGDREKLQTAFAYYGGRTPLHTEVFEQEGEWVTHSVRQPLQMVGVEARWHYRQWCLEGEYARRYLKMNGRQEVLVATFIQSYYHFMLPGKTIFNFLSPLLRWDLGNGIDYLNTLTHQRETFSANRITAGLTLGMNTKWTISELRLNYEKYLPKQKPSDFETNRQLHDRFFLELMISF